jgi:aspartyl-tRNA(Asn)/glutamyl-tRNA(Gln) amidotransferase subunit B
MSRQEELYETVVGLEVHMQLRTRSKAFCADATTYGAPPNTLVSPVSLGHPGTLPRMNEAVISFAVRLGLATQCAIREVNQFARKNYFYADLPKGYQITQDKTPICTNGSIHIRLKDGSEKQIGIERIHMEEDAGKSMHDQDPFDSLIDLNRAGVPLLEMVSRPDLRSGEEAYAYLMEVRKLVRHLEICDGNMEEGSLRCDANISVRKYGAEQFGRKVEVKNMNSMRHVQKAIEFEAKRQIAAIEAGETIAMETRTFDAVNGVTFPMRMKEGADDYRYFPEPDLPPVLVSEAFIEAERKQMPPLPRDLFIKYTTQWGLSEQEALTLVENKEEVLYYEALSAHTKNPKTAANWLLVQVKAYLNENGLGINSFPLSPEQLAALIGLVAEKKVSHSAAAGTLFEALCKTPEENAESLARTLGLIQESDSGSLQPLIDEVLATFPDEVNKYREGKTGLLGMFVGQVMKLSKGKADPKVTSELLIKALTK